MLISYRKRKIVKRNRTKCYNNKLYQGGEVSVKCYVYVNEVPIEEVSEEQLEKLKLKMMEAFRDIFGLQIPKRNT